MLLGITDNLQENKRLAAIKKIRLTTAAFLFTVLLPFVIYFLFHYKVISSKSSFTSDIQEPVAKIVTSKGRTVINKSDTLHRTSFFQKIKPSLVAPSFFQNTTGLSAYWSL